MTSFNLVGEQWVPVNLLDGSSTLLSLTDLFTRSREIRSVECDNPMQTAAVMRLVLAVVYRALTPLFIAQAGHVKNADVQLWKMLWDDKEDAMATLVSEYLAEWEGRFDLFDTKRPFFQIAKLEYSSADENVIRIQEKQNLGRIMPDSDKIGVFRNSSYDVSIDYAEAARVLITYQSWSTLAPMSPVVGIFPEDELAVPRLYPKGHRGWCSSIGVTLMVGRNLYETLLLNFVPNQLTPKDIPFWEERIARKVPVLYTREENEKPVLKDRNAKPVGQVQLFVWFAKSVRLITDGSKVTGAVASEHDSLGRSSRVHMARHHETQTAWRETNNGEMAAYHFVSDSVWQNLPALLPRTREGFLAPLNVTWAAKVANVLGVQLPARIRIIGAKTDDKAQTFRGVIDKSVAVTSISQLDNPAVNAKLEDGANLLNKLVRSNYYGFSRDVLTARYGEVEDTRLEAAMFPANDLLDKAFVHLFRSATSEDAETQFVTIVGNLSSSLAALSLDVAEQSSGMELLGYWKTIGGETRLCSVAAARSRLMRSLRPHYTPPVVDNSESGGLVRWAISKNANVKNNVLLSTNDIEEVVLDIWSKRKTILDGSPSHQKESAPYSTFKPLRKDTGELFDSRVSALFDTNDYDQLKESLRRVAGVMNSRGFPVDFGTLADIGSLLREPGHRLYVAEILIDSHNSLTSRS